MKLYEKVLNTMSDYILYGNEDLSIIVDFLTIPSWMLFLVLLGECERKR